MGDKNSNRYEDWVYYGSDDLCKEGSLWPKVGKVGWATPGQTFCKEAMHPLYKLVLYGGYPRELGTAMKLN